MIKQKLRINEQIRTKEVRLIDEENNQVGIVTSLDALTRARDAGLDLVEVSPTSEPPVCRIMDYGKWLYEQKRKQKQNIKKQHTVTLKEIRLRPKTDDHDRQVKLGHAVKFLEKGHKVQFTILFRGREMIHQDHGEQIMGQIVQTLEAYGHVEHEVKRMGRRMTMILAPNKHS